MTRKFKDKTRGGHEVRIYATDGADMWTIHGAVKRREDQGWDIQTWDKGGRCDTMGQADPYDLIPLREPSEEAVEAAVNVTCGGRAYSVSVRAALIAPTREMLRAAYEIDGIGGGE